MIPLDFVLRILDLYIRQYLIPKPHFLSICMQRACACKLNKSKLYLVAVGSIVG